MSLQRYGVDRVISERGAKCWTTVEYKADERALDTGNAFIELAIHESDGTVNEGWARKTIAMWILYLVPGLNLLLWVDARALKHWVPRWLGTYELSNPVQNATWAAVGLLVPIHVLRQTCVKREDAVDCSSLLGEQKAAAK